MSQRLKAIFGLALGIVFAASGFAAKEPMDELFTDPQKTAIEKIVHDYLIKNPEVLVEASRILQQRERSKMTDQAQKAIPGLARKLFNSPNSQVFGNPSGDVAIVEFFDYQCGYCRQMLPIMKSIVAKDPNVKLIYKEFPIFGESSIFAAKAALAARKQEKYEALHDALFKIQERLTDEMVLEAARSAGLDVEKLQRDMKAPDVLRQLDENIQLGNALGLIGTPAFIVAAYPVNKSTKYFFVPGAPSRASLLNMIESARKKADGTESP